MSQDSQFDLPLAAATAADPNIANFVEILDHETDWITAVELLVKAGWAANDSNARKLREWANQSKGAIISGQKGYRHIRHATAEEINHAANWLEHQAKEMATRACAIRRQAHKAIH